MSSQRVAKVESLIQQTVAAEIRDLLAGDSARITITRVDAAPDLRSAIVWIGLLGTEAQTVPLWERLVGARNILQAGVSKRLTMKYSPQLHLRQDTGGAYAADIERLLRSQPDL
ncbi:ribosome-binding factor A [Candidatus Saccharibacteria bacterium]|nr:ribosome-binding factor A [Candidatus Saccharibacteria bacterium]